MPMTRTPEQLEAIIAAAGALLTRIENMTTEEFAHGGEKAEREALRAALGLGEAWASPTRPR